jgi:hypothetical protein
MFCKQPLVVGWQAPDAKFVSMELDCGWLEVDVTEGWFFSWQVLDWTVEPPESVVGQLTLPSAPQYTKTLQPGQ